MSQERDKRILQQRLERCRRLAKDFSQGPTAEHIKQIEAELLDELQALEKQ